MQEEGKQITNFILNMLYVFNYFQNMDWWDCSWEEGFFFKLRSLKISSIQIWQTLKSHSISDKLGISNHKEIYDSDPFLPLIGMKKYSSAFILRVYSKQLVATMSTLKMGYRKN